MKNLVLMLIVMIVFKTMHAQDDGLMHQGLMKLDSSYLFIDNSKQCWFTFRLQSDTVFPINNTLYFYNGKSIQINSVSFDSGNANGVSGSQQAEEFALKERAKWELEFQQESFHQQLEYGDEFYQNAFGKPFLLWWIETPKNTVVPVKEIEVDLSKPGSPADEAAGSEIEVTHQLFLNFIIHGNMSSSVSIPVLETETLESQKQQLIAIANSLKVYGSFIDLKMLADRELDNKHIFHDSLSFIEIDLPVWLNICSIPYAKTMFGTFPEKDNIYNAVGIVWEYKNGSKTFDDFVADRRKRGKKKENVVVLQDDAKIKREYYTSNNSFFRCQGVYLEGDNAFCMVNFTATETTYEFNIERFNELISRIRMK
jgi:hypothetical protein